MVTFCYNYQAEKYCKEGEQAQMKRFLPLFLIVAMLVTMIPSVAFAEESTENTEPTAPTEPVIVDTDKEFKPINVVGRDSGLPTDVPAKMGYTIMRASQNILDCIKSVEGFVEHEYRDNNTYSIGYGTVISYYAPDIEDYVYNEERKAALALAERLKNVTLEFKMGHGQDGHLYGSVTSKDIAEALKKEISTEIDKRKINLKILAVIDSCRI